MAGGAAMNYAPRVFFDRFSFADLTVLLVAVIWGASYTATKVALGSSGVLEFLAIRFAVTFLGMLPFFWRELVGRSSDYLYVGLLLGTVLFASFMFETYGVKNTSASNAAFLISLCVLFTPMLDSLFMRSKLDWPVIGVALLCVAGAAVISGGGGTGVSPGDLLVIVAALCRGVMVTATKKLTLGKTLSSGALTTVQMFTVACLATGAIFLQPGDAKIDLSLNWQFVAAIVFLTVLATGFAFYVQTHMVRETSPVRVAFLMGTEPVFGVACAVAFLGETLSWPTVVGGSIIVISMFAGIQLESRKERISLPN